MMNNDLFPPSDSISSFFSCENDILLLSSWLLPLPSPSAYLHLKTFRPIKTNPLLETDGPLPSPFLHPSELPSQKVPASCFKRMPMVCMSGIFRFLAAAAAVPAAGCVDRSIDRWIGLDDGYSGGWMSPR